LARLGIPVSFHGAVGQDDAGDLLRRHAGDSGVDIAHLGASESPTMRAVATIDPTGVPRYRFNTPDCAAMRWAPAPDELADSPALLHVGSIASWLSPVAEAIARLVENAAARGVLVSFDPNLRPVLMSDPDERDGALTRIDALLRRADLVKASTEDLAWVSPESTPVDAAAAWSRRSTALVVLTDGPSLATAFLDGHVVAERPSIPVQVQDTVGAGDAFMAAALAELAARAAWTRSAVRALAADPRAVADLLDAGNTAAAITCERAGADPPTAAELAERLPRGR
jgi:fructokinase